MMWRARPEEKFQRRTSIKTRPISNIHHGKNSTLEESEVNKGEEQKWEEKKNIGEEILFV